MFLSKYITESKKNFGKIHKVHRQKKVLGIKIPTTGQFFLLKSTVLQFVFVYLYFIFIIITKCKYFGMHVVVLIQLPRGEIIYSSFTKILILQQH